MDFLPHLIIITLSFFMLVVSYAFGRRAERTHYTSIVEREKAYGPQIVMTQTKTLPPNIKNHRAQMVVGSVVVSVDHFKRTVATWKAVFGGELKGYHSMLDRARREAVLRLQEEALELGADHVVNLRMETMSISKGVKNTMGSVEVMAYGTALIPR